ncbi:unnamed protein product [Scytosiphon promiscuus]
MTRAAPAPHYRSHFATCHSLNLEERAPVQLSSQEESFYPGRTQRSRTAARATLSSSIMTRTSAASLAAVSVLLSLATTPCSGRTHLRGSVASTEREERRRGAGGHHLRGSVAAPSTTAVEVEKRRGTSVKRKLRNGRGNRQTRRRLQTPSSSTVVDNGPALPDCTSLFVPTLAGPLSGTYTFQGRYNDGRPVYVEPATGNNVFAMSSEVGAGGWLGPASWYITQADPSSKFFLSLESSVFEPSDLEELQPWVRHNDPECRGCTSSLLIKCMVYAEDDDDTFGSDTGAENDTGVLETGNSTSSNSTSSAPAANTQASSVDGCASLSIANGADRTGAYALATVTDGDGVVVRNGRPSYAAVGENRTDEVFSTTMDVCAAGYGVVDTAWADAVGVLVPTATVDAVFLMYVAENVDLGGDNSSVPVWLVTSEGVSGLETADEYTFLAVSDLEDPSEVTSWAKFTPATGTARATLEENSWVQIGCGDAEESDEGDELVGESALGVPSPPPAAVGTEPNARRLRR